MRSFYFPGRSPVHSLNSMVASPNPAATLTAIEVLRDGGNAIDAAVAAAAVLAVVEPHQTGIGGDCFVLYAPKGGSDLVAYNGSGRAPRAAAVEWYHDQEISHIEETSPHAVTVPGAVDAWDTVVKGHGSKTLAELLEPAIRYAEEGYVVHSRTAFDWAQSIDRLKLDLNAMRVLLPNGKAPKAGERHSQPMLAMTLRQIARYGRSGFYQGSIAKEMVNYLRERGGLHTIEDFADARGEYVEPIGTDYHGFRVCQMPPNNQGITALIMLNILSGFELSRLDPLGAERLRLQIEAGRLAYSERNAHISDVSTMEISTSSLLSADYSQALRQRMGFDSAETANYPIKLRRADTVYLSVVDRDRNAVSFINSLFHSFGSGLMPPTSGVLLQSRGASFNLDPVHPNCIGPGKRPMHTIMPGMLLEDNRAIMSFGVMGGDFQPFGHVHFLTNVLDFGCDIQEALDMARVFYDGTTLQLEPGIPAPTVEILRKSGFKVGLPSEPLGGGQAVYIDWKNGVLTGASDPRMDGCALGL